MGLLETKGSREGEPLVEGESWGAKEESIGLDITLERSKWRTSKVGGVVVVEVEQVRQLVVETNFGIEGQMSQERKVA